MKRWFNIRSLLTFYGGFFGSMAVTFGLHGDWALCVAYAVLSAANLTLWVWGVCRD